VRVVLADARRGHPGLYWFAVTTAGFAVVIAALAVIDQRVLLGAPIWIKPLKFAISFAAYAGTLAWMLGQLRTPVLRRTGWVIVAAAIIELSIITGQAARGVPSHFNDDNLTGELLFSIMGATIVVLYLATVAVASRFLREPGRDRASATAIRLGLFVALVGMAEGFLMVPNGAHTVGAPDGGAGLPLVGWSAVGGDLRIAHFVGMHALQLLPLLAAGLGAFGRNRLDEAGRVHVVVVAAAGYTGLVLLLTWQALRAQPLLAPDAATLATLAALVLGTGGVLHAVLRAADCRRAAPTAVTS
jgi:hypothetical protein